MHLERGNTTDVKAVEIHRRFLGMDLLELEIARRLKNKKKSLVIAESCTGGLVSHRITNTPGSSVYFKGAVVAYSNKVKETLLAVPKSTVKKHGAVSRQVALAMADGVREALSGDIAVSITGIAGPGGGSFAKPAGLAYIAFSSQKKKRSKKVFFTGDRLSVKEKFSGAALKFLLENI